MSDEYAPRPEDEQDEADLAEAEEERAAVEEAAEHLEDDEAARQAEVQEALTEVARRELLDRAWWSRVHKEHLTLLFANCLLFAGALAAWARPPFGAENVDASAYIDGLNTIRGSAIFALAIYGFFVSVFNIWYRQIKLWPFLLGGLLGLWAGIEGILAAIDSGAVKAGAEHAEKVGGSFLNVALMPLSAIAPGYYLITAGGALVLFVLLKGIMSGRAQARASTTGTSRRRRR